MLEECIYHMENTGEKMDEYLFDDLSMELRSLFDMVKEPLVESFFLKGEPDHCLGTCLKRCPESLLDVIAEEKKGKDSWSRWNIRLLRGCPQRSKQCRQMSFNC